MDKLAKAKIAIQSNDSGNMHLHGVEGEAILQTSFVNNEFHTGYQEGFENGRPKVEIKKDGFWMVVSDWSTCTVACGTGT